MRLMTKDLFSFPIVIIGIGSILSGTQLFSSVYQIQKLLTIALFITSKTCFGHFPHHLPGGGSFVLAILEQHAIAHHGIGKGEGFH